MEEKKHHIHFTTEYIRKYLDGQLSDTEMLELEKAALEDPFLADAIEGYEESRKHPVSFESGVEAIQKKLSLRIRNSNRQTRMVWMFSHWKVAASVLFLLGITFFTVVMVSNNRKAEIADQFKKSKSTEPNIPLPVSTDTNSKARESARPEPVNPQTDIPGTATISSLPEKLPGKDKGLSAPSSNGNAAAVKKTVTVQESEDPGNLTAKNKNLSPKPEEKVNEQHKRDIVAGAPYSKDQPDSAMEKAADRTIAKNNTNPALSPARVDEQLEGKISGLTIEQNKNMSETLIKGIVVDEKNKPVPFAAVSIKGTQRRTLTDTGGFFKLYMKNPSLASLIFTDPASHEATTAELLPDSVYTNRFRLRTAESSPEEDDMSLNESVNSLGFSKSRTNQKADSVNGWAAFYRFVNENKKIISTDSLLKGEEIISFLVQPDGKLTSFRIEKSISPAHDSEIMKLIRTGPALKPMLQKKQRCRLVISFK